MTHIPVSQGPMLSPAHTQCCINLGTPFTTLIGSALMNIVHQNQKPRFYASESACASSTQSPEYATLYIVKTYLYTSLLHVGYKGTH